MIPTTEELHAAGLYPWCPDCGEYLWDDKIGPNGDFRSDCPRCDWPTPDHEVTSDETRTQ